jgi:hypothetical protein
VVNVYIGHGYSHIHTHTQVTQTNFTNMKIQVNENNWYLLAMTVMKWPSDICPWYPYGPDEQMPDGMN